MKMIGPFSWVKSTVANPRETITFGYFGKSELNREAFTADGWFRTGDLGVLRVGGHRPPLQQGRLTITGREKDVIIIGGRNFSSHEIETVVEEIDGVETSFTAASAVRRSSDTDQLAVFFSGSQELIDKIREQVVRSLG
jgi:acyl-CoA synthetase (AMP-forming)/AMP-acid ligase II